MNLKELVIMAKGYPAEPFRIKAIEYVNKRVYEPRQLRFFTGRFEHI